MKTAKKRQIEPVDTGDVAGREPSGASGTKRSGDKVKTVGHYKTVRTVWTVVSYAVCFAPVAAVVALRREELFVGYGGVKLAAGLTVGLVIALLAALDKLKVPGRVIGVGTVFALSWLLESLLDSLVLISGVLFCGTLLDAAVCQPVIRGLTRKIEREEKVEDVKRAFKGE